VTGHITAPPLPHSKHQPCQQASTAPYANPASHNTDGVFMWMYSSRHTAHSRGHACTPACMLACMHAQNTPTTRGPQPHRVGARAVHVHVYKLRTRRCCCRPPLPAAAPLLCGPLSSVSSRQCCCRVRRQRPLLLLLLLLLLSGWVHHCDVLILTVTQRDGGVLQQASNINVNT
jgi:hypothetical protein